MKKYYHYIVLLLFLQTTTAQTLFTDNFDSYTVGNLGTDMFGTIPGQGGWMTKRYGTNPLITSNSVQVVAETGRGKVLQFLNGAPNLIYHGYHVYQPNINALIDWRTVGNNVIALQFDFFTGPQRPGPISDDSNVTEIFLHTAEDSLKYHNTLLKFKYNYRDGKASLHYKVRADVNTSGPLWPHHTNPILPYNTWVTFKIYLDYNNQKIYAEDVYHNKVYAGNFLENEAPAYLLEKYKPKYLGVRVAIGFGDYTGSLPYPHVYSQLDNITLTALKSVPPHVLSAESFLATKFNMYPNPATNIVNITNGENLLIQQIAIYDTAGKLITTENYNNKTEIQLNVAHLASGTYMLHLTTDKGKAVKKLVKK